MAEITYTHITDGEYCGGCGLINKLGLFGGFCRRFKKSIADPNDKHKLERCQDCLNEFK